MKWFLFFLLLFAPVTAAQEDGCPNMPPLALTVGGEGRVTPGYNNRLRDHPSTGGSVIASIPGGALFTVAGEAQCADGYRWWNVTWEGQTGWTAEGADGDYFLAVTATPTATPVPVSEEDSPVLDRITDTKRWGTGHPQTLAWSADGQKLAVLTSAWIMVNSTIDYDLIYLPPTSGAYTSIAFHPINANQLFAMERNGDLWMWDTTLNHSTLVASEGSSGGITFNADGSRLFVRTSGGYSVWDTAAWQKLYTITLEKDSSAVVSPDGTRIAVRGEHLQILDSTGQVLKTFESNPSVRLMAISPDNQWLAGMDFSGYFYVWSMDTGEQFAHEPSEPDTPATPVIESMQFLADGRLLTGDTVTWGGGGMSLWNPTELDEPLQRTGDSGRDIYRLKLSPDQSQVAVLVAPSRLSTAVDSFHWALLDMETFEVTHRGDPFTTISSLAGSEVSIAYKTHDGALELRDINSGELLKTFRYNGGHIAGLTLKPDGDLITFCTVPPGSLDWSPDIFGYSLRESVEAFQLMEFYEIGDGVDTLSCRWMTYDPQRRDFLIDSSMGIYTVLGAEQIFKSDDYMPLTNNAFARGNLVWMVGLDGVYKVNLDNGTMEQKIERRLTIEPQRHIPVSSAMFEDRLAFVGGLNGMTVYFYDTASETEQFSFEVDSTVMSLVFAPDGASIVTGHEDGRILHWDAETGETLGQIARIPAAVNALVFSPDGSKLFTTGRDEVGRMWDLQE